MIVWRGTQSANPELPTAAWIERLRPRGPPTEPDAGDA